MFADRTVNKLECNQYTGDRQALYQQALDAAKDVINDSNYSLIDCNAGTIKEIAEKFHNIIITNNEETIWSKQYVNKDLNADNWVRNRVALLHGPNGYHNWAGTAPTHDLVMAFETEEGKILNTLLKPGESTTENPYMNREPRFYATVAYNGCLWNGTNAVQSYDRNLIIWYYRGEESGWSNSGDRWLATGIGIRKFVSSRDNFKTEGGVISKPVIGIRYADVLLWYAEALNELGASTYQIPSWDGTQSYDISRDKNEMSYAISRVRIRGGVPDFGSDVYENADEFRKHLKHERQIELFAENSRYFDLRRWKDAEYEESQQMYGCNAYMSKTERDLFHTQVINSNLPTTFSRKMYFWPISHDQLRRNLRLTQNPGWTYYD